MGRISKLVNSARKRLVPRDAHSSVRLWLLGPWEDRPPVLISDFDSAPVLVLAPHADDEAIGPGGAVLRHLAAGAEVIVVILTDGRWGGFNGDGKLVERRKQESIAAAKIMGTPPPLFWNAPDAALDETPGISKKIADLIAAKKPKYVYLPALTDAHVDHWATNCALHDALEELGAATGDLIIRGFEVWTPALANCCIDITAFADRKAKAIEAFASQTDGHDYVAAALGLNRYRSLLHLNGRGFAEAFMQMNSREFRALFEAASLRNKPNGGKKT